MNNNTNSIVEFGISKLEALLGNYKVNLNELGTIGFSHQISSYARAISLLFYLGLIEGSYENFLGKVHINVNGEPSHGIGMKFRELLLWHNAGSRRSNYVTRDAITNTFLGVQLQHGTSKIEEILQGFRYALFESIENTIPHGENRTQTSVYNKLKTGGINSLGDFFIHHRQNWQTTFKGFVFSGGVGNKKIEVIASVFRNNKLDPSMTYEEFNLLKELGDLLESNKQLL